MPSCLPKKGGVCRIPRSRDEIKELLLHNRTWIVCWARMSAARKRNRSMTASNGHTPKRFAETRSHTFMCSKGFRDAAPDKQRAVFAAAGNCPKKQSGYFFALLAQVIPNP